MKKLKAFTIVELSVTLLISAIVISIAYFAFLLFINQYKVQQKKSGFIREYFLFCKVMQTDMDRSDFIKDSASYLDFGYLNSSGRVIYDFGDSFVTRKFSGIADTFYVKKLRYEFSHVNESSDMVNSVKVLFDLQKDQLEAVFNKAYSSREQLKHIDHHE